MKRTSWHEIMMQHALAAAKRSRCVRHQVGAVIADSTFRILSTGYNGPPGALVQDEALCDTFCPRSMTTNPQPHYLDCVAIHAEANALLRLHDYGMHDLRIYVTGPICWDCAKMIANTPITCVRFMPDPSVSHREEDRGIVLLHQCGIKVKPWMT